ncbi:MAG: SUMF1/EgtB/PvdO family nonheme iron enzyme [Bacteroidia bacterium]|nr:SUMF1/EgtB/PvdO family nonheme iron enzyme [Bacteroidia bacterium]
MKKLLFSIIIFLLFAKGFLPAQGSPKAPKNCAYLPMGSFKMKVIDGKDTSQKTVSVQSFFMTAEVSNKEYRVFVNYLKTHPADSLYYFDLRKLAKHRFKPLLKSIDSVKRDSLVKNRRTEINQYKIFKINADLLKDIIDTNVWEGLFADNKKMQEKYNRYFSDKVFDNYPVVGVSYENAYWYCIWKSKMENDERIKKGEMIENDYRLPTEAEWAYAASQTKADSTKSNSIHSAKEGEKNNFKLKNLDGNVSEWTVSWSDYSYYTDYRDGDEAPPKKVVKGGSWKTKKSVEERKLYDKSERNCYTGFRMVKTYTNFSRKDDI